jgi:hypothetical protein
VIGEAQRAEDVASATTDRDPVERRILAVLQFGQKGG